MSRSLRRYSLSEDAQVDMTPMLDIVFIMLIFFIVTAVFMDERGPDITQPPESNVIRPSVKAVQIYIDENNSISLSGERVEMAAIADRVETLMADGQIKSAILTAHTVSDFESSVKIKDSLTSRGLPVSIKVVR